MWRSTSFGRSASDATFRISNRGSRAPAGCVHWQSRSSPAALSAAAIMVSSSRACCGDVGGGCWASVDALASAHRARTGAALAAVEEHAEHIRLRVREGLGMPPSATGTAEASLLLEKVVRVRWLAWSTSCLDSMSMCGSTGPEAARVGEANDGGGESSRSMSVPLRGCLKMYCQRRILRGLGYHAEAAAADRVVCSRQAAGKHFRSPGPRRPHPQVTSSSDSSSPPTRPFFFPEAIYLV